MAGAYIKHLDLSWKEYLNLYNEQNLELLNKSKLPESFTKHENNIVKTLTISQKIIDEEPKLKEIINLLSYGANEPIDDELITKLLACKYTDIIEAIKLGIKLKYIKKSSQGYTIHRLLKEVWKIQEKLEQTFIDSVAKNLANYIYEIKDEFLNLSKIEIANLFSQQWIINLANNDTKAILIAYRAYLDYYKGNYESGLKIVNIAEEIVEKRDSKEYAEILTYQGSLNYVLENYRLAKVFYEQSFEIYERLYPNQNHSDIIICLNNLGAIWKIEDTDKALNFHILSFEMSKKLFFNQDNPHSARALNNLGSIFWDTNKPNDAFDYFEESLKMKERLYLNQDHPDIAITLDSLGIIWKSKNPIKALNFHKQSFAMYKNLYQNQNHPNTVLSMFNLASLSCESPATKKKGIELLKQYKKIVTKQEYKQEIENILKKYDSIIGRDKSKRKRK